MLKDMLQKTTNSALSQGKIESQYIPLVEIGSFLGFFCMSISCYAVGENVFQISSYFGNQVRLVYRKRAI